MMLNQKQIEYPIKISDIGLITINDLALMTDSNILFAYRAKHFETKSLIRFIVQHNKNLINRLKVYIERNHIDELDYLNKLLLLI